MSLMKKLARSILAAFIVIFGCSSSIVVAENHPLDSMEQMMKGKEQPAVLVFISFSMPNESVKGWMNDAARIHAPILIRGLVNNSFKDTVQKISTLVQDNRGGVQVDPTAFERFHITQVPAVVVQNTECPETQSCVDKYDVIYGDVKLEYALRKIASQKSTVSVIAEKALEKWNLTQHQQNDKNNKNNEKNQNKKK